MKRMIPALIALTLGGSGCYKVVYKTGAPVGNPAPTLNGAWHIGAVNGLVEITSFPTLQQECPQGFAEVRTQQDFIKGLVTNFVDGILFFQDVTVYCAAAGGAPPPASQLSAPAKQMAAK